jgi:hypothetical protein
MELMRATWTDSRLDDLNGRVGEIREDIRYLRDEMQEMRADLGAFKRAPIQIGGGMIGTLVVGMLGLIATQL